MVLVLKAANARDEAIRLADDGRHEAARGVLRAVSAELRSAKTSVGADQAEELEREAAELDASGALLTPDAYSASGAPRKQLRYAAQQRQRRRK